VRGEQLGRLWRGLHDVTGAIIDNSLHRMDIEDNDEEEVETSLKVLQAVATISMNFLADRKRAPPDLMGKTVQLMHDVLLELTGARGWALQNDIARTCEDWWSADRPNKEGLVNQTLPYLVARVLDEEGRASDMKRLFAMRAALLLLDFTNESIESMRELLLRCFVHPLFLKTADGRKFCVYLFGLHPTLITDIHETIKQQLPFCSKHMCELYGEIYFKAWRTASGPYLIRIETGCVQDLMSAATHASTMSLFNALRRVLGAFHGQKKARGVDEMLLRLYEPILWRGLTAANPHVRRSAATLLIDAFPLHDPDGSLEAMDVVLQKQFDCLRSLLTDSTVAVRCVGVSGICRVLCVYWEVIPTTTTKTFLELLVTQCARDANAAAVRVAVCEGLGYLLDNQLSHLALKDCLPRLEFMIHDRSPKVRSGFVALLLRVKHVRSIRFYNVCPIADLLARIAAESPHGGVMTPTAAGLIDLLLNSYMPYEKDETTQLRRCLSLCKKNPRAAVVFYMSVYPWVPATASVSLGCQLLEFVEAVGEAGMQPALDVYGLASQDDDDDGANESMGASDAADAVAPKKKKRKSAKLSAELSDKETKLVVTCLEVALELLQHKDAKADSPEEDVQADAEEAERLVRSSLTQSKLVQLLTASCFASNSRVWACIVRMAALLPASAVPLMVKDCSEQLFSLPSTARPDNFEPLLRCMTSWGTTDQIFKLLTSSLATSTSAIDMDKSAEAPAAAAAAAESGSPGLALRVIDFMLSTPGLKEVLTATESQSNMREIEQAILKALEDHVEALSGETSRIRALAGWEDETALDAMLVYGKLLLSNAVRAEPKSEALSAAGEDLTRFFSWASESLGSYLSANEGDNETPPPAFVPQACQLVLATAAETHALGVPKMLDNGGAMALWQCQHEFACVALRTSHNVSAGTIATISKMILQAHDGWTRPHPENPSMAMPMVPRKQLHQLLCGLGTMCDAATVWPLRTVFTRLMTIFKRLPLSAYGEFIAQGLLGAALAGVCTPEDATELGLVIDANDLPAAMSVLVMQCRDGKTRQASAFGRIGKDDSAAVLAAAEKQFVAATDKCKAATAIASGDEGEEGMNLDPDQVLDASDEDKAEQDSEASLGAVYGVVQLMLALTNGADGLRATAATKTAATASIGECVAAGVQGSRSRTALVRALSLSATALFALACSAGWRASLGTCMCVLAGISIDAYASGGSAMRDWKDKDTKRERNERKKRERRRRLFVHSMRRRQRAVCYKAFVTSNRRFIIVWIHTHSLCPLRLAHIGPAAGAAPVPAGAPSSTNLS
jgi:hypothetical protein